MSLLGWFKRLGLTLNSGAEPTDEAFGGESAPTSVVAEASTQIEQEMTEEKELEEGR